VLGVLGEDQLPEQSGGFRIIKLLGRGGMGMVMEAEQEQPQRRVALKVVQSGLVNAQTLRRLQREAQILAVLDHPGIARIYSAGVVDFGYGGRPYYAMELIKGATITQYAEAEKLDTRGRLELFVKVCDAVQHAHEKGVVHRDLKPGNILVTPDGQPKILDFGVARTTNADVQLTTIQTETRQIVGTLPYMSPEQAISDRERIGVRSDVYSLGALLYELLVGRPPLNVKNRAVHEAVLVIRDEEPTRLGTINRTFRGDVEVMALKALAKEPQERYDSAAALAADARRWLSDQPILARPPSTIYQLLKFARRNKVVVAGVLAIILILAAALLVVSLQANSLARAKSDADYEARRATAVNELLQSAMTSVTAAGDGSRATLDDFLQAVQLSLDSGKHDPGVEISARMTLARVFTMAVRFEEAVEQYELVLALAESAERVDELTVTNATTGVRNLREILDSKSDAAQQAVRLLTIRRRMLAFREGRQFELLDETAGWLEENRNEYLLNPSPNPLFYLHSTRDLAWVRIWQGHPDSARTLLHAALQEASSAELPPAGLEWPAVPAALSDLKLCLGAADLELGYFAEAEHHLRQGEREILRSLQNPATESAALASAELRRFRELLIRLYEEWEQPAHAARVRAMLEAHLHEPLDLEPVGQGTGEEGSGSLPAEVPQTEGG
ncbi:MAG: serine/threonine-protein kinase, partial [Phycisphaerales bacterium JB038]